MKYIYEYRTRENEPRSGEIDAANREAVFAALKKQGIRPGRVVEAPGLFNKLFGKGKRWMAIAVLAILLLVLTFAWVSGSRERAIADVETEMYAERSQIYGDPWAMKYVGANGWAEVFADEGDRYLARHAIPGVKCGCAMGPEAKVRVSRALAEGMTRLAQPQPSDLVEVRKIKRIVNGMKRELASYIADGGAIEKYMERLDVRQQAEMNIVKEARRMLERTADPKIWRETNMKLRNMGLAMIVEDAE